MRKESMMSKNAKDQKMSRRELFFGAKKRIQQNIEDIRDMNSPEATEKPPSSEETTLLQHGFEALKADDIPAAIEKLRAYSRILPEYTPGRRALGYCLFREGKHIQARVEFERVIRLEKQDNCSSLFLTACLLHKNKITKAIKALEGVVTPAQDDPTFVFSDMAEEQAQRLKNEGKDAVVDVLATLEDALNNHDSGLRAAVLAANETGNV